MYSGGWEKYYIGFSELIYMKDFDFYLSNIYALDYTLIDDEYIKNTPIYNPYEPTKVL